MLQVKSPNFSSRDGHKIKATVLHVTDGSFNGALSWLTSKKSQVSSHYLISPHRPYVIQLVPENMAAWHAGRVVRPTWPGMIEEQSFGGIDDKRTISSDVDLSTGEKGTDLIILENELLAGRHIKTVVNPNKYTIGIEVALPNGRTMPTWGQWLAVTRLVRDIAGRYSLPLDKHGLVNHFEINSSKTCPGFYVRRFYILLLMKFIN